jgi:LAGLIDADG endonuclease
MTENATGAENQQERLQPIPIELGHYLSGFADGEGSFNVSLVRRTDDYRNKWKIVASFNISQRSAQIPELFKQMLGCGTIRFRKDGVCYFEVRTPTDLHTLVREFFTQFPLLSDRQSERLSYLLKVVQIMMTGEHRNMRGLKEILEIREKMVCSRKRKYDIADVLKNPQRPYAGIT